MREDKRFREYEPDQSLLLPQNMGDWLPEDHLAYFVKDVVGELDLSPILGDYDNTRGGYPAYDPRMMTALLLYAYCTGSPSSRKIERATWESVPFRVLAAGAHPDHDTIASFRRRHLDALAGLFVQVLEFCREAGLVTLGRVALDGTKVRANASKHKAMSYGRMKRKRAELEAEVKELLARAETVDAEEDAQYGKGRRGGDLPEELRFREKRLAKIREAMAALEAEAAAKAEAKDAEDDRDDDEAKPPPQAEPPEKAQRNFTDPDSRIMRMGATKSFEQCYNCEAAVEADTQVIVAADVTDQANDKKQVEPMVEQVEANLGERPEALLADSGFYSRANVEYLERKGVQAFIAPDRMKHNEEHPPPRGRIPKGATVEDRMKRKLRTKRGRETYSERKSSVEPVFGQIKDARGFRRFLLRGMESVRAEWRMICLTHNMLKLFRVVRMATAG